MYKTFRDNFHLAEFLVINLELWDREPEIISDHLATSWPAGTIVGGVYSTANFENVKSGYHCLTAAKDEQ